MHRGEVKRSGLSSLFTVSCKQGKALKEPRQELRTPHDPRIILLLSRNISLRENFHGSRLRVQVARSRARNFNSS